MRSGAVIVPRMGTSVRGAMDVIAPMTVGLGVGMVVIVRRIVVGHDAVIRHDGLRRKSSSRRFCCPAESKFAGSSQSI